jgi:MFS family permease
VGTIGSGIFGILRMLSFNYWQFATFEFLDALFGAATYSTAYIIGLELVTPKNRTIFGTLLNCFYALGGIYLGIIAMNFRNYKTILMITYLPAFLVVSYICLLPQSQFSFYFSFSQTQSINFPPNLRHPMVANERIQRGSEENLVKSIEDKQNFVE